VPFHRHGTELLDFWRQEVTVTSCRKSSNAAQLGEGSMVGGLVVVVVVIDVPEAQDSQTPHGVSGAHVVHVSQHDDMGAFHGCVIEPRRSPSHIPQPVIVAPSRINPLIARIFLIIHFSYPFLPPFGGYRPDNSTPRPAMCKRNVLTFWNNSALIG
jgi:hypothetical protein